MPSRKLSNCEISRYSRQILLPTVRLVGQTNIVNSSVLIVGAGGLGSPVLMYLAAAGVGKIGIVDYDVVEINNLQRQVIHSENNVGMSKVESAAIFSKSLNSNVKVDCINASLNSSNALDIVQKYDIVVDASDNVATRYLINDACVLSGKPLVSGSALRLEGQLTTYNFNGGPCYRCIFPKPPPANTVTNCSDGGVLGAVTGTIGSLQALEVLKIISEKSSNYSQVLLLFDGSKGTFRNIKLRPRQATCNVCGDDPTITELIDYKQFCGSGPNDKSRSLHILGPEHRISCLEYAAIVKSKQQHLLLDVRDELQYEICRLDGSFNIPIDSLKDNMNSVLEHPSVKSKLPVYVICRRGNKSQVAVELLKSLPELHGLVCKDLIGGVLEWRRTVDPDFPEY